MFKKQSNISIELNYNDYNINGLAQYNHNHGAETTKIEVMENDLKIVELVLSSRLTDETYHGIMNLEKAIILKAPNEEIQKSLVSSINIL